jgi:acyl carrier protein
MGRPELTAEKFEPNKYGREEGERVYRSGDVGRYRSNGEVEFIGRADDQVKIRGYRIELGEIEAVLNGHPAVKQSVVIVREDERGDRRLLAFVVGEEGTAAVELKRHMRERLPEYMVPEAVLLLEEMPVTTNGKVDRRRLPVAQIEGGQRARQSDNARTPAEEMLAGIFGEVLEYDRIGRSENFFEIGGHSLLATQVVSRIREVFGVEIAVRSIFDEPTVEGLVRRIEEMMRGEEKEVAPPLVRVPRDRRLPLSFAQQRLWFIEQLEPGNSVYNNPGVMNLEGRLDLEALERALNEIGKRHEALRTRIEVEDGEPFQVIDAWEPWKLEIEDLTGLALEERENEAVRIASAEAGTGFDLKRGPLLRVKVLKLGEEEHVVLFTMHHLVSDGWSIGILIRETETLYQAYSMGNAGEPSPLEELPIQYADFAVWEREWLRGEVLKRELEYWRDQLAGAKALELPTDYPRPAAPSYRGARQSFVIESELAENLRLLGRQEGVTLFMTLLAAFQTLLYRFTGRQDIVVGTPFANRGRLELERLIGFLTNTLVMRSQLSDGISFRDLLQQVRETSLAAYSHAQMPFEKLVIELAPKRAVGQNPLFQVWFFLDNAYSNESSNLHEITQSAVKNDYSPAKLDLALIMTAYSDKLVGTFTYATDLFRAGTIIALIDQFRSLLQSLACDPDCKLSEIPLLKVSDGRPLIETAHINSSIDELQADFVF